MIAQPSSFLRGPLQKFYRENSQAKALFDVLASRQRDCFTLRIEYALQLTAAATGTSRRGMITVFRQFERLGLGRMICGRGSKSTRFTWSSSPKLAGRIAQGDAAAAKKEMPKPSVSASNGSAPNSERSEPDEIVLKIVISPGGAAVAHLPENSSSLSKATSFLRSLPFEPAIANGSST